MSAHPQEVGKPNPRMGRKPTTGFTGRSHTPETKAKTRAKLKDRVPPESERTNIADSKRGTQASDETKAKISAARKGTTTPDEVKAKIGASVKEARKIGIMGRETRFLTLLATGQSVREAAQTVGFHPDTAYALAQNEHFKLAIMEASMRLRATLYTKMPELLDLSFQTLADTMRSPTARHEVKVKAAAHTLQLAMFLATADKNFQPPAPSLSPEDMEIIEATVEE